MTYRLMAEWAVDLACKKLGVDRKCETAEVCLPGSSSTPQEQPRVGTTIGQRAARGRHGERTSQISLSSDHNCEGLLFQPELVGQLTEGFRFLAPYYQYLNALAADPPPPQS